MGQKFLEEPGDLQEAVEIAEAALKRRGIGLFAMAVIPTLVRKLRELDTVECQQVGRLMGQLAPIRACAIAMVILDAAEPESTGQRRG